MLIRSCDLIGSLQFQAEVAHVEPCMKELQFLIQPGTYGEQGSQRVLPVLEFQSAKWLKYATLAGVFIDFQAPEGRQ